VLRFVFEGAWLRASSRHAAFPAPHPPRWSITLVGRLPPDEGGLGRCRQASGPGAAGPLEDGLAVNGLVLEQGAQPVEVFPLNR
jgi:hypothetical protein